MPASLLPASPPRPPLLQLCMAHGSRTVTDAETSWILADIKARPPLHPHSTLHLILHNLLLAQVTKSSKGSDAPVGERLQVEKAGKGGFASLEFKPEERDGKTQFKGACRSVTVLVVTAFTFTFISTIHRCHPANRSLTPSAPSGVIHSIKEAGRFGFILARCDASPSLHLGRARTPSFFTIILVAASATGGALCT